MKSMEQFSVVPRMEPVFGQAPGPANIAPSATEGDAPCPACGSLNNPKQWYCGFCGAEMRSDHGASAAGFAPVRPVAGLSGNSFISAPTTPEWVRAKSMPTLFGGAQPRRSGFWKFLFLLVLMGTGLFMMYRQWNAVHLPQSHPAVPAVSGEAASVPSVS